MTAYGQRQYQRTQVTTVDGGRLIVLLYEGCLKFLRQAKECIQAGDYGGKSNYINRALDIISELNQSLNMNDGGEIAGNLRRLYLFWSEHLIQAKIKKDSRNLDEVINMMASINEAWSYALSRPEAQEALPKNEAQTRNTKAEITV